MNIGVIAIPKKTGVPTVKFTSELKRVLKPWGGKANYNQERLENDLKSAKTYLESQSFDPETFDNYRTKFMSFLVFEKPRPTIFTNLTETVNFILSTLVDDPNIDDEMPEEEEVHKLDLSPFIEEMKAEGIVLLEKPKITIPTMESEFTADFSYLNAKRHYVKSVLFHANKTKFDKDVGAIGMAGFLLAQTPVSGIEQQLVTVAAFERESDSERVKRTLNQFKVKVVDKNDIGLFINEVRKHAH